MTNGEKFIHDNLTSIPYFVDNKVLLNMEFDAEWWNAEYKEPVIRDNRVKNELNQVKNELEPTTKNDVPDINVGEIKPITRNDCEHCSRTYGSSGCCPAISNKWGYSCKEGHEEYARGIREIGSTTKNNLAVDKEQLKTMIRGLTKWYVKRDNTEVGEPNTAVGLLYDDVMFGIDRLPSVTPQEPKTGHWILTDVESNKVWHCHCSECGKDPQDYVGGSENWWLIKSKLPKFCPSCGSDNREVVEK